jgi:hypothetical protein
MSPAFDEGIYQPVHIEDDPQPQQVPLEAYFHQETAPASRNYPGHQHSIAVSRCRFNGAGEHTYMAEKCPHYDVTDEQGPRIRPGWTVQG